MSIKIKSPTFPESVADGTVANWLKKEGENVNQDEVIAEIETDKVVLEVLAQADGVITKIIKSEGDTVSSAEVIGEFSESDNSSKTSSDIKEKQIKTEKKISKPAVKKIGPAAKKIISEKFQKQIPLLTSLANGILCQLSFGLQIISHRLRC